MITFNPALAAATLLSGSVIAVLAFGSNAALAEDLADYKTLVGYTCAEGPNLQVFYQGKGTRDFATLSLEDAAPVELEIAMSGSGVRYADENVSWHTKAETGILEIGGQTFICTETFAAVTPKEQARVLAGEDPAFLTAPFPWQFQADARAPSLTYCDDCGEKPPIVLECHADRSQIRILLGEFAQASPRQDVSRVDVSVDGAATSFPLLEHRAGTRGFTPMIEISAKDPLLLRALDGDWMTIRYGARLLELPISGAGTHFEELVIPCGV